MLLGKDFQEAPTFEINYRPTTEAERRGLEQNLPSESSRRASIVPSAIDVEVISLEDFQKLVRKYQDNALSKKILGQASPSASFSGRNPSAPELPSEAFAPEVPDLGLNHPRYNIMHMPYAPPMPERSVFDPVDDRGIRVGGFPSMSNSFLSSAPASPAEAPLPKGLDKSILDIVEAVQSLPDKGDFSGTFLEEQDSLVRKISDQVDPKPSSAPRLGGSASSPVEPYALSVPGIEGISDSLNVIGSDLSKMAEVNSEAAIGFQNEVENYRKMLEYSQSSPSAPFLDSSFEAPSLPSALSASSELQQAFGDIVEIVETGGNDLSKMSGVDTEAVFNFQKELLDYDRRMNDYVRGLNEASLSDNTLSEAPSSVIVESPKLEKEIGKRRGGDGIILQAYSWNRISG